MGRLPSHTNGSLIIHSGTRSRGNLELPSEPSEGIWILSRAQGTWNFSQGLVLEGTKTFTQHHVLEGTWNFVQKLVLEGTWNFPQELVLEGTWTFPQEVVLEGT